MSAYLQIFMQEIDRIENFCLNQQQMLKQEFEDIKKRMQIKNRADNNNNLGIQDISTLVGESEETMRKDSNEASSPLLKAISPKPKQAKKVEGQKITKVKDELEYATNWRRAFTNLYTHLKWLNAYSKINNIALLKIQKKFMKTFFCLKDNILDKKLAIVIKSQTFTNHKHVQNLAS